MIANYKMSLLYLKLFFILYIIFYVYDVISIRENREDYYKIIFFNKIDKKYLKINAISLLGKMPYDKKS